MMFLAVTSIVFVNILNRDALSEPSPPSLLLGRYEQIFSWYHTISNCGSCCLLVLLCI
jgi:hypothetical protein